MKTLIIIVAFITACICLIWVFEKPGFDSYAALGAALVGFIGAFFISPSNSGAQNQKVANSKFTIQAGRDVKINSDKGDSD